MLQKWKNRPPRSNGGEFGPGLRIPGLCLFKLGVHLGVIWCFTKIAEWLEAHNRCWFFLKALLVLCVFCLLYTSDAADE